MRQPAEVIKPLGLWTVPTRSVLGEGCAYKDELEVDAPLAACLCGLRGDDSIRRHESTALSLVLRNVIRCTHERNHTRSLLSVLQCYWHLVTLNLTAPKVAAIAATVQTGFRFAIPSSSLEPDDVETLAPIHMDPVFQMRNLRGASGILCPTHRGALVISD